MIAIPPFPIRREDSAMAPAIERLLDSVFGPARFEKASHRYRENLAPIAELSWAAFEGEELVGTIRYWPILIGNAGYPALLLGPLGIAPRLAGRGIGRSLTFRTLDIAAGMGLDLVLLVGDVDYYKRFGFVPATPYGFVMPGEARPERLQVTALRPNILGQVAGEIRHFHSGLPALVTGLAKRRKASRGQRRPAG